MKRQILGILLLLTVLGSISQYAEAKIPPTAAFSLINGTGGNVTSGNYKGFVTFVEGTGIALSWDYTLHKITFASTGAGNPIQNYCTGTDKFRAYNSTTHLFICDTDNMGSGSSGQNNTASSSGIGYSLVLPKVGVDLPFKGLWVSGDLSISQNATDITFSHVNPLYTIPKINNQTVQKDYQITGINNVTGVITTNQFSINSLTCSAGQFLNSLTNTTGFSACGTPTSTDTNTAQIVSAGGTTLFKQRDNATQNTIKGLTTTYGITLTANTNDVNITPNFKVNTKTPATRQFLTSFDNATTSGLFSSVTFGINSITCGANQFVNLVTNSSGLTQCATPTGSGITSINSAPATTAKLLQTNSTTKATLKTLTQGIGITLTNGSSAVTIATDHKVNTLAFVSKKFFTSFNNATTSGNFGTTTFAVNNQTSAKDVFITGINNNTGVITTNQFSVNLKTCSGTDKVSSINNSTGNVICTADTTGSGATSLIANVTQTNNPGTDTLIWTIALTANSGNTVSGVLSVDSTVTGTAVRIASNVTSLQSRGWCHYITPLTTTTDSIDNIVMNTILTGRATNTADITGLAAANVEYPISFQCSLRSGATPGNMKVYMTPEVTGATISAKAGSFYIKIP